MKVAEEFNHWNFVNVPPLKPGWYNVKTDLGECKVPYVHNAKGKLVWVHPNPESIKFWRF